MKAFQARCRIPDRLQPPGETHARKHLLDHPAQSPLARQRAFHIGPRRAQQLQRLLQPGGQSFSRMQIEAAICRMRLRQLHIGHRENLPQDADQFEAIPWIREHVQQRRRPAVPRHFHLELPFRHEPAR